MARAPYVFPIVGGRKVEHLEANIKSLEIRLTAEEIQTLNDVQKFDWGFPVRIAPSAVADPGSMSRSDATRRSTTRNPVS